MIKLINLTKLKTLIAQIIPNLNIVKFSYSQMYQIMLLKKSLKIYKVLYKSLKSIIKKLKTTLMIIAKIKKIM